MAESTQAKIKWSSPVKDVPTYHSNIAFIAHAGTESFLVFGEAVAPAPGDEPLSDLEVKPLLKIALTPDAMSQVANLMQGNVKVKEPVPETEAETDQLWYWTPAWQESERATEEDLRTGRYTDFTSMDDLLAELMADE